MDRSSETALRYIALGDSYTIGERVKEEERWPNRLVEDLKKAGVEVELVANPSVTGWRSDQLIDEELPLVTTTKAQFATVLIGVNDWVQGVDVDTFRSQFRQIVTELPELLEEPKKVLVVTIPDFSKTPQGALYGAGRDISAGIQEFNLVIEEESKRVGFPVVDIFEISQRAEGKPELVAEDGLHPSAAQYLLWEKLILPAVIELLHPDAL